MVQRKASYKLGSQTKSKNETVKHQRNLSSYHQQDSRNKGGGDTKKDVKMKSTNLQSEQVQFNQATMHKRSSAIKVSDQLPNYMKPTSSSDARKEKFKVTNHSPATNDRIRSPRNLSNLNYSKPSSTSSPDGSGRKHVKVLKRKPSLKQVRPWMKKSLGIALCPKLNANRATCSSTLTDSKFPKALGLNPGRTKAEGTSVMHVCPYTYCSLNEHGHEPLPPLKSFLSSRRKLLRTQKSMKVKGVSPFRKKAPGKDEKEEETGQAVLSRAPSALGILMEEVANDFFVEIYTKPCKHNVKSVNCDEGCLQENNNTQNSEVLNNVEPTEDDGEGANCEEDDDERNQKDEIHEYNSVISFKEDLYQNSDLSIEEMDVMTSCLEFVNCDQQDQDKEGNPASLVRKDDKKMRLECQVMDGFVKDAEGFAGSAIKVPFGASEMNLKEDGETFPGNKTCCSESTDDGLGPLFEYLFENDDPGSRLSLNPEITSVPCKIDEAESPFAAYEVAECAHTTVSEGISSDRDDVYSIEENGSPAINYVICDYNVQDQRTEFLTSEPHEAETYKENDLGNPPCSKESNLSQSFLGHLEASTGAEEGREVENDLSKQNGEGEVSEAVDLEVNHILDNASVEKAILNVGIKEEDDGNEEVEDASSSSNIHLSGSDEGSTERENGTTGGDHIQTEMEIKIYKHDDEEPSVLLKIHRPFNDPSDDIDKGDNREKSEERHEEANETGGISQTTEQDWYETDHAAQLMNNLEICLTASTEGPEEDIINDFVPAPSNQAPPEAHGKQKDKISMVRSRTEEEDQMKVSNPQGPNFLPVEPDPAAEKVDLRHQEIDERKNAEEWMIDYALQQAVTKLAPARERKVEVLVEAFETVSPMPMCEKAMQHTGQELDHASPLQECS